MGLATGALATGAQPSFAMGGSPVPVGCVATDDPDLVLNCSGDLSAGVPFVVVTPLPISASITMNVFDVTKDIRPAEGPGIALAYSGQVIIHSDTGSRLTITQGAPAIIGQGSLVSITHSGDIVASGPESFGIFGESLFCECDPGDSPFSAPAEKPALSNFGVTIISNADIDVGSHGAGIVAIADVGNVAVDSTGDIKGGTRSSGIIAVSNRPGSPLGPVGGGDVSLVSNGDITLDSSGAVADWEPGELGERLPPWQAGLLAYNGGVGNITVVSRGNITTSEKGRDGIDAYSAGFAGGSTVSVFSTGNISTTGEDAAGILAGADFADVAIVSKGNIKTTGAYAAGLDGYANYDGTVSITSNGNIDASGVGAFGIRASGYSDLSITINGGTVSGGSGDTSSVGFFAGDRNLLVNRGTITGGKSGWAIEADNIGSEQIENYGTISGNVETNLTPDDDWSDTDRIESGSDSFNNHKGAVFNAGQWVELDDDGLLLNEGALNPGGIGKVETTRLVARLEQTQTGVIGIDIKGKSADRIDIDRAQFLADFVPAAILSGKVAPNLMSFDTSSAHQKFTIVSAAGEIVDEGLTVADTALVDYSLIYPNGNQVVLQLDARFTAEGLSSNQAAALEYLGRLLGTADARQLDDLYLTLLTAPDTATVAAITEQLTSGAGSNGIMALAASDGFAQALRSCPVAEGPYGQLKETSCVWAKPNAREFQQSGGNGRSDIDSNSSGLMGGVQAEMGKDVFVGVGFAVEETNASIDQRTSSEGTWWQAGSVLKWVNGPWKLSGSISGGKGDVAMSRALGIVAPGVVAASNADLHTFKGLSQLSYSFGATGFYVTPMVEIGASYVRMDGFTETGAGLFNLAVESADQWIISGGPAVEIGATAQAEGITFRPFVKGGVTFFSEDTFETAARFAGTSASAKAFALTSKFDDTLATIDAGVQLFSADGLNLRLQYQGRYGADSHQNGVDAKLSINY